ncbi:unnamed protein product, partial [Larinioides sclopetarius]
CLFTFLILTAFTFLETKSQYIYSRNKTCRSVKTQKVKPSQRDQSEDETGVTSANHSTNEIEVRLHKTRKYKKSLSLCDILYRNLVENSIGRKLGLTPPTTMMSDMIYPYENGHPDVRLGDDSLFSTVEPAPPVEIFALHKAYHEDKSSQKVDLTIGAYRDEEGRPWVLPVVRQVEEEITSGQNLSHEYLGQLGLEELSSAATKLLLGSDSIALKQGRAFGVQTVGGTGALRVGAEFLVKCAKLKSFYMADPCWPSHHLVFPYAGFAVCRIYRYWHSMKKCLDIEGLLEDLRDAPPGSVVILHVCAHNPTGIDPSKDQWMRIADVMQERRLFPFFDCAYQGIASGDLEKDAWPVRYFVSRGLELLCAQSFSKNMGLYSERVGNLTLVFKDPEVIPNVRSHITMVIRGNYCNPPRHGAGIATRILNDNRLIDDWSVCLRD